MTRQRKLLIIFLMKEMEEILMLKIMPPYGFFEY